MVTSPSISQLCVMLAVLLLGGAVFAEEVLPQQPGLYDGAVGVKRDEIADNSLTRQNSETMENASLRQVITRVEEMTGMQVWLDEQAFTDAGIDLTRDTIIVLWLKGETVTQLTNYLSDKTRYQLAWVIHEGVATLTTEEKAYETYVTKQYPIGDLLPEGQDPKPLIELLQNSTSGPWDDEEPGTGTIHPFQDLLIIRQTHRNQQEVVATLAGLRREERMILLDSSDDDLLLRRSLEKKLVSFDWPDVTLGDLTNQLQETTGVKFRLDEQGLTDAGLDKDTRVDARAVNLPLVVALLKNLGNVHGTELTVHIADEECLITTAEKVNEMYETILYRVGAWGITGGDVDEFAALLELETSGPWDANEQGTGTINVFEPRSLLAVRQVPRVHREILEILRDLHPMSSMRPRPAATPVVQTAAPQITSAIQSHSNHMSPEVPVALVKTPTFRLPRIPNLFAAVTWEVVWVYAPLLMALLLGGVTGYLGRH